MNFSGTTTEEIYKWIDNKNNGDDTYYLKGKEDTQEAIGVFRSLYDKEYEDVLQLFNYLRDNLKLREAGTNSLYRAFISLYYNDDVINIRLSRHFSTEHSLEMAIDTKGKPDMEYHLVIDKEQSRKENPINKDTTYNGIKIRVVDIDLKEFNNEILDEIILLLTNGTTKKPSTNISVDSGGNYVSANGWGADYVSESRLSNIIRESINRFLLTEDRGSRSMKSARNYALQVLGDKQEAINLVNKIRNDLELHNDAEAFVLAGTRMKLNNEYDDTIKEKLISVIRLIAGKYLDQYNNDLNGLSAQEVITQHSSELQRMRDDERDKLSQMQFDGNSDYDIVRIDSFEQAQEYGRYTPWCITHNEINYNEYTSNGSNQFYFCLRNGFERVLEEQGEGYPLDDYGLSMFAVRVDENGDLIGCTTRWNLGNDRDQNAMSAKQISTLIGMDFYKVFKPNTKLKEALDNAMQRLANGEDPKDVFDYCDIFVDGYARVKLKRKWNFINQNGELLSKKQWFDGCRIFKNGFAIVELNMKFNFISQNGKLLYGDMDTSQWFDICGLFDKYGFAEVKLNGKWGYIDKNGNITKKRPQVSESYLRNVIRESIMNYIKMDMIQ